MWIEYKNLPITIPKINVIPDLSPQQFYWIKSRIAEGRKIWVVVGYKGGVVKYTTLKDMELGFTPEEFMRRTMSRKELANEITAYCGPAG